MRELRHDFRHHYHVAYEDVPAEEALDLIEALPDGSAYVAATYPLRAWGETRGMLSDVVDGLYLLAWRLGTWKDMDEPPHVTRPRDVAARREAKARAKRARETIEGTKWEEV